MAQFRHKAGEYKVEKKFPPVPEGEYVVNIIKSEWKIAKSSGNEYLALSLKIIDTEYSGRIIFVNLNLKHPDENTRGYAINNLNGICRALFIPEFLDTEGLHDKDFKVVVGIKEDKNVVYAYRRMRDEGGNPQAPVIKKPTSKTEESAPEDMLDDDIPF